MSDEAVREALTPDDALRRRMETALKIADAKMALGVACRGGHLRMTIPANPKHDHDLIIGEALRAAGELLDDLGIALAKANAELQGAQRADGYTESDPRLTRQLAAECVQLKVELAAAQREREASRQAALGALGSVANAEACGWSDALDAVTLDKFRVDGRSDGAPADRRWLLHEKNDIAPLRARHPKPPAPPANLSHESIREALRRGEKDTFPAPPAAVEPKACRWRKLVTYRWQTECGALNEPGLLAEDVTDATCTRCGGRVVVEGA